MKTITDIFRSYGPEYLARFGKSMPEIHRRVIDAIMLCRTEHFGVTVYECDQCHKRHWIFRSCGNRHCPACQNHKARQWLQKQMEKQLPGPHFMVTFTVPAPLRALMRSRQRVSYNAFFRASSEAMKKLAADEKWIGGDLPGFFGVLHTWGRMLQYHPHIHYVVTGGAISKGTGRWHPSGAAFFLPNRALSVICRAKFRETMARAGLLDQIPAEVWQTPWNVNIQPVGSSEQSIGYLAPYVFKVAITNSRILRVEDHKVVFRYKKKKSARWRSLSLDVLEFMRRFLQHVLPAGFMKIRYFGFLHPGSSFSLEKVRALIEWTCGVAESTPKAETAETVKPFCPQCGGAMRYLYSILPHQMTQAFLPAPSKARMAGNSG